MKTWIQPVSLLRNDEQKIVTNGYPYLRVHGVLGSAVESPDVKMLLDPFEEQFYLPAFTVEFRNSQRIVNRKVVGQKSIYSSSLKVFIYNKSQCVGILSGRVISSKSDSLIRKNARVYVNRSGLNNLIRHIVLGACNKVGFLYQSHRKVLIYTPILLLVGLRKRGSRYCLDSGAIEVAAEVKCSLYISQTSSVCELSEDCFSFVHGLRITS